MAAKKLTVGVTGATGTIGRGLLPFLERDRAIGRVIGVGSREWRPDARLRKLEYRRADVRDRYTIRRALDGADVVVHLAFSLYGVRSDDETLAEINVQGSTNVLDAAAAVGAKRFIYTSSGAVYGFDSARPVRVDEDAPVAPGPRHFYSRHKAAVETALIQRLEELPGMGWVFFRPCAVVGPDAAGAASHLLPRPFADGLGALMSIGGSAGLRPPVPGPPVPLQFVHARDVGQAIHRAIKSDRSGAIYNLGGDGMVAARDAPRLLGLHTAPVPGALTRGVVGLGSRLPYVTPALGWLQLLTHPLELDASRAKRELGWKPEFSSRTALESTRRALAI